MTDLVEFIRARLDEDEQAAREANTSPEMVTGIPRSYAEAPIARHIARFADPARVLREVEADRKLIAAFLDIERRLSENTAKHTRMMRDPAANAADLPSVRSHGWELVGRGQGLRFALMVRAERFDDHPDYRQEWRP